MIRTFAALLLPAALLLLPRPHRRPVGATVPGIRLPQGTTKQAATSCRGTTPTSPTAGTARSAPTVAATSSSTRTAPARCSSTTLRTGSTTSLGGTWRSETPSPPSAGTPRGAPSCASTRRARSRRTGCRSETSRRDRPHPGPSLTARASLLLRGAFGGVDLDALLLPGGSPPRRRKKVAAIRVLLEADPGCRADACSIRSTPRVRSRWSRSFGGSRPFLSRRAGSASSRRSDQPNSSEGSPCPVWSRDFFS